MTSHSENLAKLKANKQPSKKAKTKKRAPVRAKKNGKTTIRISRELFAQELIKNGMNATAAYKAVSPKVTDKTAAANGHRLLREAETIEILTPMLERLFTKAGIDAEYVFSRWVEMSQASPLDYFEVTMDGQLGPLKLDDLTPAQRLNLREVKVHRTAHGETITVKVADQQRAVEMIARYLGLLTDKVPKEDTERIGDLIEAGVRRIRATKDLEGWRDVVFENHREDE